MEKVYVVGHKKPDTDSVTSAINLAYLKKYQGLDTKACVLGEINRESKFVLDYFQVPEPEYLNDVKLQIKDLNYRKKCYLKDKVSIRKVYDFLTENEITGVPIVDDNQKFISLVTLKGIVRAFIDEDTHRLFTSYENILDTLQGEEILKFDDEIDGRLKIASYKSTTFIENVVLNPADALIVGDRHSIIEYAVKSAIKLLIITGNGAIKEEHLQIAKENHVNVIRTALETFDTAKQINLSNYIKTLIQEGRFTTFEETDYYDDFMIKSASLRYNNYPVIGKNNKCMGLLRITDIDKKNRKKIILVDHTEKEQSVDGLEEAQILEIVDHHNLGSISTKEPISFRSMAVGSTNTLLYYMFEEQGVTMPRQIQGLMLSGILSDTLALTSPTTTDLDKNVVEKLSKELNLNYQEYAREMFKAGTSLEGRSREDILTSDMKAFPFEDTKFAVSQIFTLNFDSIYQEKEEYLELMEKMREDKGYKFIIVAVTDILKNGSYLFYTKSAKQTLESAYNIEELEQGAYIAGLVSRKKQIIPKVLEYMK